MRLPVPPTPKSLRAQLADILEASWIRPTCHTLNEHHDSYPAVVERKGQPPKGAVQSVHCPTSVLVVKTARAVAGIAVAP